MFNLKFFSDRVAAAMESYGEKCPELRDCKPTVKLIKRVNSLIQAMSSRTPENALRFDSCEARVRFIVVQKMKNETKFSKKIPSRYQNRVSVCLIF